MRLHLRRSILAALWVPAAALLGPVIALRHGLPQAIGGAVALSIIFTVGWLWQHLDERVVARRRLRWLAFTAGVVLGVGLMLTSYGQADAYYVHRLAYPRDVVVAKAGCTKVKQGCANWAELSTPDGEPLPLNMYDLAANAKAGQRLIVRWDRLGYASPTPTAYPGTTEPYAGVSSLVPAWVWAGLLALYLGRTAVLGYRAYRADQRADATLA